MSAKVLKGKIVNIKDQKTIKVSVERSKYSKTYNKRYLTHKNYQVDYNGQSLNIGDEVVITQGSPKSKLKHWELKEVIK